MGSTETDPQEVGNRCNDIYFRLVKEVRYVLVAVCTVTGGLFLRIAIKEFIDHSTKLQQLSVAQRVSCVFLAAMIMFSFSVFILVAWKHETTNPKMKSMHQ